MNPLLFFEKWFLKENLLFCCTDNLTGFSEAIASIFPRARVELCIVHPDREPQIRNSLHYVTHEDSKQVMKDLKAIYQASSPEHEENLLVLKENRVAER